MATKAGTNRYSSRFPDLPSQFWREALGFRLSSIGIGTYLGEPDEATDQAYCAAVKTAVSLGVNVVDTAINYRFFVLETAGHLQCLSAHPPLASRVTNEPS